MNIESLKYPIGKFQKPAAFTADGLQAQIKSIANFPEKLMQVIENITDIQLNTPYRPQGWTVRQVIHHCADSHINSFSRFKFALTEDAPIIKPYNEVAWAQLSDAQDFPIESSLLILKGLHQRWVQMLAHLSESEWEKYFIHPAQGEKITLAHATYLYAWHGEHHLAHIQLVMNK